MTMWSTRSSLRYYSYRTKPVNSMLLLREKRSMFAFSKCNCKQIQVYGHFISKNSFSKHTLEELIIHSLKTAYIFHLAII